MLSLEECQIFTHGKWLVRPAELLAKVAVETASRKDCHDAMFVAFEGENFDAHQFLEIVVSSGSQAICIHQGAGEELIRQATKSGCGILQVADTVKAYQDLATGMLKNGQ